MPPKKRQKPPGRKPKPEAADASAPLPSLPEDCPPDAEPVLLGTFGRAQGLKGVVSLKSYCENPQAITAYSPLFDSSGNTYRLTVRNTGKPGMLHVAVEGVTDRTAAETLNGVKLYTLRSALPAGDDEGFLIQDILGLEVRNLDGRAIGTVAAMHNFGAGDILEVRFADGKEDMFGFTEHTVPEIDIEKGYMVLAAPEILEAKEEKQNG